MDLHDLTAGYALDALDPDERARYEEHLASCESCREELQEFWQVAGALGRAAGGPTPPASLRDRILEQARDERPNVVPLRRAVRSCRRSRIGRGGGGGRRRARYLVARSRATSTTRTACSPCSSDPNARVPERNGEANLVVTPTGQAALVVRMLAPAPAGKDYEIWVFENGVPERAGLFEQPGVAMLTRKVEPGQTVAVTLEPDGGVDAPTSDPLFTASSA